MVMLSPHPRAEYGLAFDQPNFTMEPDHTMRWGRQVGSSTGRLIVPESFSPQRQFDPINVLLSGRRGQMKTATMTAIAYMLQQAYQRQRKGFRVASNIWLKFAQENGPLGFEHETVFNETTQKFERVSIPVDPCSPMLVDRLMSFPPWGQRLLVAVDELSSVANNRKSLSSYNTNFGVVLEQQRKKDIEYVATTQFPQKLDTNALLLQIDLFVILQAHSDRRSADLFVFDHWGQFTGKQFRKYWPPHIGEHDWELGIQNVDRIWGLYSTKEIVPPSWSSHRERVLGQQWSEDATRNTYEIDQSDRQHDGLAEIDAPWVPETADQDELLGTILGLGNGFTLSAARRSMRHIIDPVGWLKDHGWYIEQVGKTQRVYREEGA